MKRRVIYMSDTEWASLSEVARTHSQTISSLIRERVGLLPRDGWHETPPEKASRDLGEAAAEAENAMSDLGRAVKTARVNPKRLPPYAGRPTDAERQAHRDAILRRVNAKPRG